MAGLDESQLRTLIDELLAEQQSLTAVERFSRQHDQHAIPAQSRYYRELIPLAAPQPGEQYAFGVDLDACTGCKACVSACHSLNGLDDGEIWRNVGLLQGGSAEEPYQQTVTTACHHCVELACRQGCPVRAYEKDAVTGIVRHLDDQCIGCQYCVLKCPYDVPKYSAKRGIVRKCDMCHSRLAANEAPACVQACPTGAITIRVVSKAALLAATEPGAQLLPGTFDSEYTTPTTHYRSNREMPANAHPGDSRLLRLEPAHGPLIGMLVLTQVATGLFVAATVLALASPASFALNQGLLAFVGFGLLQLGLAISVLHLGRPLGAWRAFLGLRTSWMSREIFAFGAFAGLATACVVSGTWKVLVSHAPLFSHLESWIDPAPFAAHLAQATALFGLFSVFCSAMIYIDTRRPFWSGERTFPKFFGTTLLLGASTAGALLAWQGALTGGPLGAAAQTAGVVATLIRTALFGWEFQGLRQALTHEGDPVHRSAVTIWHRLRPLVLARGLLFVASTASGLIALNHSGLAAALAATTSFLATTLSQFLERYTFFTAVIAPRMPGAPSPGHLLRE